MGGHSSRDALDVDLVRTEVEMLMSQLPLLKDVLEYSRMVDDNQSIMQGDFRNVVKAILLMAQSYPTMPLNVQLSFMYSRYLDVHVYNIFQPGTVEYSLYTTLAWKDMNSFCYAPATSNKHPSYKTSVVPITMHRIDRRCTDISDKQSHGDFIFKILKSRGLDMAGVRQRIRAFNRKKNVGKQSGKNNGQFGRSYMVTYDSVSKSHKFVMDIIRISSGSLHRPKPMSISHPTLASILCPKRHTIRRIAKYKQQR